MHADMTKRRLAAHHAQHTRPVLLSAVHVRVQHAQQWRGKDNVFDVFRREQHRMLVARAQPVQRTSIGVNDSQQRLMRDVTAARHVQRREAAARQP
jgi:hypothetical protein